MNERIRRLAEQSGFQFGDYNEPTQRKVGLLSELIVRECANIVDDAVLHREPASTYATKIQQHFGVTK